MQKLFKQQDSINLMCIKKSDVSAKTNFKKENENYFTKSFVTIHVYHKLPLLPMKFFSPF